MILLKNLAILVEYIVSKHILYFFIKPRIVLDTALTDLLIIVDRLD